MMDRHHSRPAAEADGRWAITSGCAAGERLVTDSEPTLSILQLQVILQSEGYPVSSYGIGRRGQYLYQAVVIDQWSTRWVVYYIERGTKAEIRKHRTEEATCLDF